MGKTDCDDLDRLNTFCFPAIGGKQVRGLPRCSLIHDGRPPINGSALGEREGRIAEIHDHTKP
jgi:hypothetical protein